MEENNENGKNLIAVITKMNPQVENGKIGITVNTPEPHGEFEALIDKKYIKKYSLGKGTILEARLVLTRGIPDFTGDKCLKKNVVTMYDELYSLNICEGETIYQR